MIICFILISYEEILQHIHRVNKDLQNEHVGLKSCADLYFTLAQYLHASRNESIRVEEAAIELMPGVDYKATNAERGLQGN